MPIWIISIEGIFGRSPQSCGTGEPSQAFQFDTLTSFVFNNVFKSSASPRLFFIFWSRLPPWDLSFRERYGGSKSLDMFCYQYSNFLNYPVWISQVFQEVIWKFFSLRASLQFNTIQWQGALLSWFENPDWIPIGYMILSNFVSSQFLSRA